MLLKSTFPQLLPAGPNEGFRMSVWWPTQTKRQVDSGPPSPHVVARGGIQIKGRGKSLADEALHREAVEKHFSGTKHLFECGKASVRRDQSELKQSIFQVITREMCTPGWVKEARVPDSDVVFPWENKPVSRRSTPLTFLWGFVSATGRETTSSYPNKNKHSIAVGLWARPPVLSPSLS